MKLYFFILITIYGHIVALGKNTDYSTNQNIKQVVNSVDTTFSIVSEGIYLVSDSISYYSENSLFGFILTEKYYSTDWQLIVNKEFEYFENTVNRVTYTLYYPNGKIKEKFSTKGLLGSYEGFYFSCYENGKIKELGNYRFELIDPIVVMEKLIKPKFWEDRRYEEYEEVGIMTIKEQKIGKWRYFDEYGTLIRLEDYP